MTQPNYGFTQEPPPGAPGAVQVNVVQQGGNGMAVAGLVLGILGLVLCFIPVFGQILAVLGIIFGAVGMSKANKIGGKGKGLATAGLATGLLGLIAGIVIFALALQEAKRQIRDGRDFEYHGQLLIQHDSPRA